MSQPNLEDISQKLAPLELRPLPPDPLVSVLMTNYNYAQFIGISIQNTLDQTYPYFELIICDDGSTDHSVKIIEEFSLKDKRVKIIKKENGGQTSALIAAYAKAQGEIICLLDSDDAMFPDKLEKVVAAFRENRQAGCCLHQMLPVSKTGQPISKPIPTALEEGWLAPQLLRQGLFGCFVSTSAISFRRQITELIFPLPASFTTQYANKGAPTDTYLLGIARLHTPVTPIYEPLVNYRFHGANDGSAQTPTVKSISQVIEHLQTVYEFLYQHLKSHYGEKAVETVRLEDSATYLEYLLALYILKRKPKEGIKGFSAGAILTRLPANRRKQVWRVILRLPAGLAGQAFKWWWGMAPWKRFIRPVWRLLRIDHYPPGRYKSGNTQ